MLQTLPSVLPEIVMDGMIVSADAPPLTVASPPADVKKAYMKAVRLIHPDKLSATIDIRSKVMAEAVFSIISEMYDLYRNAHGL